MMIHPAESRVDSPALYRQSPYGYGYHHPSRLQSLSVGAIHPLDRTPFSAGGYGPHYQEYMRFGELGMGMGGDNKQRKRRGNLPKETTDKLRAWFVAHLHHPYPTEDEKQELMRQTGLQMNQISNWFINARRRQLPTMINNARAESDAMSSGRSQDGKVLPSTERDYEADGKDRHSPTISDGGDSTYDDDLDARRRSAQLKRGGSY
ncbi:homeodomain superfamily [Cytospora paraplurivora]|uniref:Homeodomain superfamily n=1 Tax=Cytospora paraplurivora TaxID=2898453 RepID=A0AAN9U0C4_9PEZI